MASVSRISLFWFLGWAVAVVLVASVAANSEISPLPIQEELAKEIENLEVINQLNSGQMDSEQVALQRESEARSATETRADSRRSPQRSILSRR